MVIRLKVVGDLFGNVMGIGKLWIVQSVIAEEEDR